MKNKIKSAACLILIIFVCACSSGGQTSSTEATSKLIVSQDIPNLFLNQSWNVTIRSKAAPTESITVSLDSAYGIYLSAQKVTLSPESPIATIQVYGDLITTNTRIKASSPNNQIGFSNYFNVLSGQLPDNGGVADLETVSGSNNILVASTYGNVYQSTIRSNDKSSSLWQLLAGESVPDHAFINDMDYDQANNDIYVSTSKGNSYLSLKGVDKWRLIGGGSLPNNAIAYGSIIDKSGNLIVGTSDAYLYISSPNGLWQMIGNNILPDGGVISDEKGMLILPPVGEIESIIVGTSNGHVYSSEINITSLKSSRWVQIGESINVPITAINIDTTQNPESGNLYLGTSTGQIFYLSPDNVNSWHGISGGELVNIGSIEQLVIGNNSDIYILQKNASSRFSAYFSQSPNFTIWQLIGLILQNTSPDGCEISEVVTNFPGATNQFIGTSCGNVYFSQSGFTNWKPVGLP